MKGYCYATMFRYLTLAKSNLLMLIIGKKLYISIPSFTLSIIFNVFNQNLCVTKKIH